jgi:hypothetical protein
MSNNNPLKFQVDRLFERGLVERDQQFPDRDPAANKTSVDGQNADSLLKAASSTMNGFVFRTQ